MQRLAGIFSCENRVGKLFVEKNSRPINFFVVLPGVDKQSFPKMKGFRATGCNVPAGFVLKMIGLIHICLCASA